MNIGSVACLLVLTATSSFVLATETTQLRGRLLNQLDSYHLDPWWTQLAECQGDCDDDQDCQSGLKCFHRNGWEQVPGCQGYGEEGWDYCIREIQADYYITNVGIDPLQKLDKCQGDCDDDDDCLGSLVCYHRYEPNPSPTVPGCIGTPLGSYDYCVHMDKKN